MKSIPFQTRFWSDGYIDKLSNSEKLLFIYLFSNEQVNMIGIYELPDRRIRIALDFSIEELAEIKSKFESDSKFFFHKGWVYAVNHYKYNKLSTAPNLLNYYREIIKSVPKDTLDFFNKKKKIKNLKYIYPYMDMDMDIDRRVGGRVGQAQEIVNPDDIPL